MVKVLSGLVAAIVIAVGGFFGFQFYTQHRIASEVDAALEQIRAAGGKASRGKVSFDLLSRTVTIAEIAAQSAAQHPTSVKIGSLTASGVSQPDAARFSAENIDITDVEVGAAMAPQAALSLAYKVPRIIVKDYSGPASLQRLPASSSFADVYRSVLEQFAGVTTASITAPSLTGTINSGLATPGGGEVAYTGLAMQDIKDGKVASAKIDGAVFTVNAQGAGGKPDKLTGNLANIAGYDIDSRAVAAMFDPQKASDDQYYRAYRQITTGPYVVTSAQGLNMRIDGITIDDLGLRPSRMQVPDLLAMIPAPGAAPPTPAQARALIEKVAKLYEGMRIGNAEMRGFSVETPQGPIKLSTMRLDLDNGKVNEFAIEGVDGRAPEGPVKLGRFALKSLDVANLLRLSAQFAGSPPPPDKALDMIPLIGGAELRGLVAPFKNTGKQVSIEQFSLDWGQFVGPIPTKVRMTTRMTTPLDASDPMLKALIAAGLDKAVIDNDVGAVWTEATKTFALEPVSLELGGLLKANARLSLTNVPRGVFTLNPVQAAAMAEQIEAGPLEFVLRDTGAVDIAVAQYARLQDVSREAARSAIVDMIRSAREPAAGYPDVLAALDAVARFVETPRQTLNVKLTPRGKLPLQQLNQHMNADPLLALAQFRIEASTGL
ncbi:hypothetical protein [Bradyrhizobium sp. AUGA SZCCT0182]|uniref:hypothetical protein n=1 Tax=Bradyrhizobium sp. AUGA SZCCT0182 TaxID=2807667 RepID=UPI001BA847EE|nr:hypothetical protein [Bradyrhizobium sp. AUGA SZCCT0182]MBR1235948.1 hypothetical protein [Bradyrhizobium sp. AUGA SZCCT0182]